MPKHVRCGYIAIYKNSDDGLRSFQGFIFFTCGLVSAATSEAKVSCVLHFPCLSKYAEQNYLIKHVCTSAVRLACRWSRLDRFDQHYEGRINVNIII